MQDIYVRNLLPYRRIESLSLLHIGQQVIFLNETGTQIWALIDGERTAEDIASHLAHSQVPGMKAAIHGHVQQFMRTMALHGALRTKGGAKTPDDSAGAAVVSNARNVTAGAASDAESTLAICMTPKRQDVKLDTVRDRIEQSYWKNSYIQKMHLELTYRCNFKCVHCYNATHTGAETEMPAALWHSVLGQLAEMGCHTVTFTGGEVFVRKDALELMQAACGHGFSILINTNGSLIDEAVVRKLEAIRPYIQMVEISFYGATSEVHDKLANRPGGHQNTMRALRLLQEARIPVLAKFVTMRDNFDGIPVFEREMRNMKARFIVSSGALLPRTDRNDSPLLQILTDEQYARLLATRPKSACAPLSTELKRCQPGRVRGAISPDGSVSPCELLTDFRLGNVKHHRLRDIWYSPPFLNFRKTFDTESDCTSCGLNSSCQRCPATSYLETGHLLHCAPVPRHYAVMHQRHTHAAEA